MINMAAINWLAVLVGVVFSQVLGFLWYGPLFGKAWLRMLGKTMDELEADNMMYVKTVLTALITQIALNLVVVGMGAVGFGAGALVGLLALVGFAASATFLYTTFEGPPENVWALNAAYLLVVFVIMGGVYAIW